MDARALIGTWKSYRMDYLAVNKPSEAYTKLKLVLTADGSGEVKMGIMPVKLKFNWHIEDGEMVGYDKSRRTVFSAGDIGNGEIRFMWADTMSYEPNFAYYLRRS